MSVYDYIGTKLQSINDLSGEAIIYAYDLIGNKIFPDYDPTDFNLKVMSFNNQSWTGLSAWTYMESVFEDYDVDIIGTQESHSNSNLVSLGYTNTATGSAGEIVFSKYQLNNITEKKYETTRSDTIGRWYQKMFFTFDNKTIAFFNTHLEASGYESHKVAQAAELFNAFQNEEYFIITGDFNTVCKSVNDTEYTTIMKQFIDARYNSANCSNQFGFNDTWTSGSTASGTWYPCDHIITSENIEIHNVIVDTTKIDAASQTGQSIDHLPIIAFLKII